MMPSPYGENVMGEWGCVVGFKCVKILNKYILNKFPSYNISSTWKTNAAQQYTIVDKNITYNN
jgi:hypothetical protein